MSKKVLAIVGAGPEIGLAMAKRFGREGYRIGLISRSQQKLDRMVEELGGLGIEAVGFSADVLDRPALTAALQKVKTHFGSAIDALEYSPLIVMKALIDVLDITVEDIDEHINFQLYGAMTAVKAVVDDMIAKGDGMIFITTGASAHMSAPSHANGSLGVVALRQYALMLHTALRPKGVYVGTVSIARPHSGDEIAETYWQMGQKRDGAERLDGDPRLMGAYEELVAMGLGATYPPALTAALPAPRTARDRNLFLVALFHIYNNRLGGLGDPSDMEKVSKLAEGLGGDRSKPFFGGDIDSVYRPIELR